MDAGFSGWSSYTGLLRPERRNMARFPLSEGRPFAKIVVPEADARALRRKPGRGRADHRPSG